MKLRRIMAAATASALAVGGLMVGGSAAIAAPSSVEWVPVGAIAPTDASTEGTLYNQWHFDPDHQTGASQEPNGLLVSGSGDVLVMLGNGNDIAKTSPASQPDSTSLVDLANSLWIVSSDDSKVSYQIPVFYNYDNVANKWKYTTLRHNAADASESWTTSGAIGSDYAANDSAPLSDLVAALNLAQNDARAIGAGFIVQNPGADVLVSSFTSLRAEGYVTTKFYEPGPVDLVNTNALGEFVHSADIRPDETSYPGWHQGSSGANVGTYTSVESGATVSGLQVTGTSQILNGFAPENFLDNNLFQVLFAGVSVNGVPAGDAVGYTFQVPIFFYSEGQIGQQFTTLRVAVPEDGVITPELQWTASRAIGSMPAGTVGSLWDLLDGASSYQVLGYGAYIESGSVLLQSITFNGLTTSFVKAAPAPAPASKGPQTIANTGAGDITPMIGMAALALLVLGGVTLAARRVRQS